MQTIKQIAEEIDKLNPDLTDFYADLANLGKRPTALIKSLIEQPYTILNHFKIELALILVSTHSKMYLCSETAGYFKQWAESNSLSMYKFTPAAGIYDRTVQDIRNIFYFKNYTDTQKELLILLNTTNPRKYMNIYMKNIAKTTPRVSTVIHKQIEPNEMSLAIFTNWINGLKSINSVQAIGFLKQSKSFTQPFKSKFLDAVMTKCSKPSLVLQRFIEEFYSLDDKYSNIRRYMIRSKIDVNNLLAFPSMYNQTDSAFRPFVTNIALSPTQDTNEFTSVISIALVLLQNPQGYDKPFIDNMINGVIQYVQLEDHTKLLNETKQNLQTAQSAITQLLEKL